MSSSLYKDDTFSMTFDVHSQKMED